MRFQDYFHVYNILIDEELLQNFKQVKICVMYISGKLLKFSVNELLKFRHVYGVAHMAVMFWKIKTHKDTHADTRTLTQIKSLLFFGKIAKRNQILKQLRQSWSAKFKFFNGNINSKKDPGQIERNKLTYLHYLNKMIEKYKMTKFIFHEFSCFYSELFQRLCLDFKWLQLSLSIQWTPLADNSRPKATIKNLSEILEN